MELRWLGHACFLLELEGVRAILDPYEVPSDIGTVDVVFGSHNHYDHFDADSVERVRGDETTVVLPKSCKKEVRRFDAVALEPGDETSVGGLTVRAFPAYNVGKRFHKKSENWLSYLISAGDHSVFHAGDTSKIPEYEQLAGKVEVAILPVGGQYTMDFEEAIEAAKVIQPQYLVPCHQWDADLGEFKAMAEDALPNVSIAVLEDQNLSL